MMLTEELDRLGYRLCDKFFNSDDLSLDTSSGVFTLQFEDEDRSKSVRRSLFRKEVTKRIFQAKLLVTGVENCEIQDRAGIGRYTFESLQLMGGVAERVLIITCTPRFDILIRLSEDAHVRIEDTRRPLGTRTITYFLGIEIDKGQLD